MSVHPLADASSFDAFRSPGVRPIKKTDSTTSVLISIRSESAMPSYLHTGSYSPKTKVQGTCFAAFHPAAFPSFLRIWISELSSSCRTDSSSLKVDSKSTPPPPFPCRVELKVSSRSLVQILPCYSSLSTLMWRAVQYLFEGPEPCINSQSVLPQ